MSTQAHLPRVSVVVPCRNEVRHIEPFLEGLAEQLPVVGGFEVIIADGMSDDGTRDVLAKRCMADSKVRYVDNAGRIVATGLNMAIRAARGEIILRMDVHTLYASDYIRECVRVLDESGADNVGGPWCAEGEGYVGGAIAVAFNSPFSSGAAPSHSAGYEGLVDSVYLGCWRRDYLIASGMFDESLVRNQDDELNLRILRQGGKVWQSPRIRSRYRPRSSVSALFRQYMQYGYWKVQVIRKHKMPASFRHVVPAAFLVLIVAFAIAATFSGVAGRVLVVMLAAYGFVSLLSSVVACALSKRWKFLPVMPVIFAAYHFGYGIGFMAGLFGSIYGSRTADTFGRLTR